MPAGRGSQAGSIRRREDTGRVLVRWAHREVFIRREALELLHPAESASGFVWGYPRNALLDPAAQKMVGGVAVGAVRYLRVSVGVGGCGEKGAGSRLVARWLCCRFTLGAYASAAELPCLLAAETAVDSTFCRCHRH